MKNLICLLFLSGSFCFLSGTFSCKKKSVVVYLVDERDSVTGTYSGIEMTYYGDEPPYPKIDTVPTLVKIRKSEQDSIVCYSYAKNNCDFSFKYHKYVFISTLDYHPPLLKYSNDSIYFFYQPGLGPNYWQDKCKKISRSS
ncbi:MAG: hypothetical protein ABSE72_06860 [Bacteroidales bacterium]|jgi:hypothetical protein